MEIIICVTLLLLGVISLMAAEFCRSNGSLRCYICANATSLLFFASSIVALFFVLKMPFFNFI